MGIADDPREQALDFAANLRRALANRGIRPATLARELGLSSSAVNQWLKQRTLPTASRVAEIATFLNISQSELMGRDSGTAGDSHQESKGETTRLSELPLQVTITPHESGNLVFGLDWTKARRDEWTIPSKAFAYRPSHKPDLCVVQIEGNAKSPEFSAGDYVVVDLAWKNITSSGTYLIAYVGHAVIKRCDPLVGRDDEKVRLTDVDGMNEQIISIKDIEVVGRVVFSLMAPR